MHLSAHNPQEMGVRLMYKQTSIKIGQLKHTCFADCVDIVIACVAATAHKAEEACIVPHYRYSRSETLLLQLASCLEPVIRAPKGLKSWWRSPGAWGAPAWATTPAGSRPPSDRFCDARYPGALQRRAVGSGIEHGQRQVLGCIDDAQKGLQLHSNRSHMSAPECKV